MEYVIEQYETVDGQCPFEDWIIDLRDMQANRKIRVRLDRLRLGNFGDCKTVDEGVLELRIDFGPGYRIYFAMVAKKLVLLLIAGTKRTQKKDIEKSKKYLQDFKIRRKDHGSK